MMDGPYRRDDGAIVLPALGSLRPHQVVHPSSPRYEDYAERLAQLEADRKRPPAPACPACGSSNTGYVEWGEIVEFDFVAENSILGGCDVVSSDEIEDEFPPYACRGCGAVFDGAGHYVPEALEDIIDE